MADYSQYRFIVGSEDYPLRFNSLIDRLQLVDDEVVSIKDATVTTGNGLTGGGNKGASASLAVGTGGQLSFTTTNSTTSNSHTHAIAKATQAQAETGTDNTVGMSTLRVVQRLMSTMATDAQINTGAGSQFVSPAGVATYYTSIIATQVLAQSGLDNIRVMTPLRVKQGMDYKKATNANAESFTGTDTWVSPLQVKNSFDANVSREYSKLNSWRARGIGEFVRTANGPYEINPEYLDGVTTEGGTSILIGWGDYITTGTKAVHVYILRSEGFGNAPSYATLPITSPMTTAGVNSIDFHPVMRKYVIGGGVFGGGTILVGDGFGVGAEWEEVSIYGWQIICVRWIPQVSRMMLLSRDRIISMVDLDNSVSSNITGGWERVVGAPDKNIIVAIANDTTGNQAVATSVNGTTWTLRDVRANGWTGLAYSPSLGLFVATSRTSSRNNKMVSEDGINWTMIDDGLAAGTRVEWCEGLGLFVTITNSNGILASVSANGYDWRQVRYDIPNLGTFSGGREAMVWNNELGVMMVAGNSASMSPGRVAYSTLG